MKKITSLFTAASLVLALSVSAAFAASNDTQKKIVPITDQEICKILERSMERSEVAAKHARIQGDMGLAKFWDKNGQDSRTIYEEHCETTFDLIG